MHTHAHTHSPVGVCQLVCDLGPDAACIDHWTRTSGQARNDWDGLCVLWGHERASLSLLAASQHPARGHSSYPGSFWSRLPPPLWAGCPPCWWKAASHQQSHQRVNFAASSRPYLLNNPVQRDYEFHFFGPRVDEAEPLALQRHVGAVFGFELVAGSLDSFFAPENCDGSDGSMRRPVCACEGTKRAAAASPCLCLSARCCRSSWWKYS